MSGEAHVRIDEGVKRGPRKLRVNSREARGLSPKPRPEDLGTWVIPADLNPDSVLERYLSEETTSQIAKQYGLSRRALVRWLREVRPNEWKAVQIVRAHVRIEDGEDGLEAADDALSLARAREIIKAAQFRLQSLDRDYAPKQELTINDNSDLGERLRRARERTIEGESERIAPQLPQSNTIDGDSTKA